MKKLTAKLLLLGMVFTAQVASGFYDSNLGRWLNRDPLGDLANKTHVQRPAHPE